MHSLDFTDAFIVHLLVSCCCCSCCCYFLQAHCNERILIRKPKFCHDCFKQWKSKYTKSKKYYQGRVHQCVVQKFF